METVMTKSISEDHLTFFNTCASYYLRGCIVVQLLLVALSGLHTQSFEQHFLAYQDANKFVLVLIAVFLLVDVFTPVSPRRRRSKFIDIGCFVTWLVGLASLLFWGLQHCNDC
jgi:hypothetical protein